VNGVTDVGIDSVLLTTSSAGVLMEDFSIFNFVVSLWIAS